MKKRFFYVKDINCKVAIEFVTKIYILERLNKYLDNLSDPTGEEFYILYKNGVTDTISEDYDGHKVSKKNIVSIVYDNTETNVVYGNFKIDKYGIVSPSVTGIIEDGVIEVQEVTEFKWNVVNDDLLYTNLNDNRKAWIKKYSNEYILTIDGNEEILWFNTIDKAKHWASINLW